MTKKLSIIVPCYFEEESIPLFYAAVEKVKPQLPEIEFFIKKSLRIRN